MLELPIKHDMLQALRAYADHGVEPGGFLTAVLENNLMEAVSRADNYNVRGLYEICCYVYNRLPSNCHGSPERVQQWFTKFK